MHRRPHLLPILLPAAPLSVQLATVAHEATHELTADTDNCSICLRAGLHKTAVPAASSCGPLPPLPASTDPYRQPAAPAVWASARQPRDPPVPEAL